MLPAAHTTTRDSCMVIKSTLKVILAGHLEMFVFNFLRPHALTLLSSVAVTNLYTGCCSFYLSRRDSILSPDCPGIEPGPPARMSEHVSERPMT